MKGKIILLSKTAAIFLSANIVMSANALTKNSKIEIKNFIGMLEIRTNDNQSLKIIESDGVKSVLDASRLIIDGGFNVKSVKCKGKGLRKKIKSGGKKGRKAGYKKLDQYPHIIIFAPQDTKLIIKKSVVFGEVGNIGEADLRLSSCDDLQLENIAGDLKLVSSGSSEVTIGDIGEQADLTVSGAADVEIDAINKAANIQVSGAGDVEIASINYRLSILASGAGDVKIIAGNVEDLDIVSSGASDIEFGGSVINANIVTSGAGDVSIRKPSEKLIATRSGAANIDIRD